jgi:uncharacterized protein YndB with AHSA1/START domain
MTDPGTLVIRRLIHASREDIFDMSVVTVELFERGAGQTELVLTHEQLPPTKVEQHTEGWAEILGELASQSPSTSGP